MSFQSSGGPAAKRRRIEAANVTLRKPFRSPLINRQQAESGPEGAQHPPATGGSSSHAAIPPRTPVTPVPSRGARPGAAAEATATAPAPSPLASRRDGLAPAANTPQPKRLVNPASRPALRSQPATGRRVSSASLASGPAISNTTKPGVNEDGDEDGDEDEDEDVLLQQIHASQRALQTQVRAAQQRLELVRQARRIEEASASSRAGSRPRDVGGGADPDSDPDGEKDGDGGGRQADAGTVVDAGLRERVARWRAASRLAAEELFGLIRERAEGMGGARAWRASRRWQARGGFWDGDGEGEGKGEGEGGEDDAERGEGWEDGESEKEEESEESEFTMVMMLLSLNIDPDMLGYDPVEDKWRD